MCGWGFLRVSSAVRPALATVLDLGARLDACWRGGTHVGCASSSFSLIVVRCALVLFLNLWCLSSESASTAVLALHSVKLSRRDLSTLSLRADGFLHACCSRGSRSLRLLGVFFLFYPFRSLLLMQHRRSLLVYSSLPHSGQFAWVSSVQ